MYFFDDSMDSQNAWCCRLISLKTILIFIEYFLDFRLDMSEKVSIINLSSYCNKSYASVVYCDSKVVFLGEGKDAIFCPFLHCVFFISLYTALHNWSSTFLNCLVFHTSYFVKISSFLVFSFFPVLCKVFPQENVLIWCLVGH